MESKKTFSLLKFLRNIILILLTIYILTIIYKASIMSYISIRTNKIKESSNYSYGHYSLFEKFPLTIAGCSAELEPSYSTKMVYFKDDVQHQTVYGEDFYISDSWNNINPETKSSYQMSSSVESSSDNAYYYYSIGFSYETDNPYELIYDKMKNNYKFSFILNPLKTIKLDLKFGNFVFENNYKRDTQFNTLYITEIIYVDINSGLLSKVDLYQLDKLLNTDVYFDYSFNTVPDGYVTIPEDLKEKIIYEADIQAAQELLQEQENQSTQ